MLKNILGATLCLLGFANAHIGVGDCPEPKLQENFDVSRYLGVWFQQARDQLSPFEFGNCQQATLSLNTDGSLKVDNSQYNAKSGEIEEAIGKAICDGPQCQVGFFGAATNGDYRVVSTDYDNFALIYSCTPAFGSIKAEFVWLLSRDAVLSDDLKAQA